MKDHDSYKNILSKNANIKANNKVGVEVSD